MIGRTNSDIVPYLFEEPLAPSVASERAGVSIDFAELDRAFDRRRRECDVLLVEGAGGLSVSITREVDMLELARRWQLPLLVVCRPNLGTLNHSKLTVEYAKTANVPVLGLVISGYPEGNSETQTSGDPLPPDVATETNPEQLPILCKVPLLGRIPYSRAVADANTDEDATLLGSLLEALPDLFGNLDFPQLERAWESVSNFTTQSYSIPRGA